jgi:hypothetical protein
MRSPQPSNYGYGDDGVYDGGDGGASFRETQLRKQQREVKGCKSASLRVLPIRQHLSAASLHR